MAHQIHRLRTQIAHALDLPDAYSGTAFSNFGVMLFPDWQAGLREVPCMLRPVVREASVVTWTWRRTTDMSHPIWM